MAFGAYRKGSIIYTGEPYVLALSPSERGKRCDYCFDNPDRLMKCSSCTLMRYCNKDCQKRDWKHHKLECQRLKAVTPNVPTESVRMMFRILLRMKNGDDISVKDTIGNRTRCFDDLISHVDDIKIDRHRTEDFMKLFQTLKIYAGDAVPLPDSIMCLELFGKMAVNTFSVLDNTMSPIGVGLYLGASALDHSCRPNASVVFHKSRVIIKATQNIKKDEKIFINYIDQLDMRADRQRQLKDQYYFDCRCPMCLDDDIEESMKGVQCQTPGCTGIIAFTKGHSILCRDMCEGKICDVTDICDAADDATLSALYVIDRLKNLQQEKKHKERLEAAETFLRTHGKALHPFHVRRVQVTDKAFDACIALKKWESAIRYGKAILEPYRLYYPPCHPSIGILLMMLGKIYLHCDKLEDAFTHLKEANSILTVTHGEDHPLVVELVSMLTACCSDIVKDNFTRNVKEVDLEED